MKAFLTLLVVTLTALASIPASADDTCGQLVKVDIRDGETQSYSYGTPDQAPIAALVLLAGGGGALDLDENGCARNLKGNTLTRNVATLREAGFVTALTDAPSDYQSGDGLGAFRGTSSHGDDLGDVIADVRGRTAAPVYVVGSSRGTISAVNAAAYLSGISAPEGVILFSPITSGRENAYKAWVAQTVFDEPLEDIHQPILVVAHESDACARTPADKAPDILARTNGVAEEMVIVTGGPATNTGVKGVKACQGKYPHGFGGQDKLVVELITDFVGKAAQR
ncbi:MAG: hypothetical protein HN813_04030 [Rhodospirillaceae bacterium]|jgi:hypothetical protein|nr:hypothetical protein [Rhodospirillaceae bacterium]MBT6404021.1 hypothetical protein [Rhodospirillaceae bacterium]MBT7361128.1 hypothetical protein [Rhodospirillaceae bacterium]